MCSRSCASSLPNRESRHCTQRRESEAPEPRECRRTRVPIASTPLMVRAGLEPPEHTHSPEGVPPARSALALVHRKVQPAGMWILGGPPAVHIALGLDQVDRLGHPLVWNGACRAQVVETSEHVVVP